LNVKGLIFQSALKVSQYNLAHTLIENRFSDAARQEGWKLMGKFAESGNYHAIIYIRDHPMAQKMREEAEGR
jgi:hypothetical protein